MIIMLSQWLENEQQQITVKFDYRSVNQLVEVQSIRGGPLSQPARGFIRSSPTQSSLAVYIKGTQLNLYICYIFNWPTFQTISPFNGYKFSHHFLKKKIIGMLWNMKIIISPLHF